MLEEGHTISQEEAYLIDISCKVLEIYIYIYIRTHESAAIWSNFLSLFTIEGFFPRVSIALQSLSQEFLLSLSSSLYDWLSNFSHHDSWITGNCSDYSGRFTRKPSFWVLRFLRCFVGNVIVVNAIKSSRRCIIVTSKNFDLYFFFFVFLPVIFFQGSESIVYSFFFFAKNATKLTRVDAIFSNNKFFYYLKIKFSNNNKLL